MAESPQLCNLLFKISLKLLTGKKPPDEIIVIDKFNEVKNLILKIFKIIKIIIVKKERFFNS